MSKGRNAPLREQQLSDGARYLRHLETVILTPTGGSVMLAEASNVFAGYIGNDFKNWGTNIPGKDTDKAAVDVHQVVRSGTYKALFESIGDPHMLCLSQGQIVEFCRSHRHLLRQAGWSTFFLFEVNGELYVADVYDNDNKLRVSPRRFDLDIVWGAGYYLRLVVKQQTA